MGLGTGEGAGGKVPNPTTLTCILVAMVPRSCSISSMSAVGAEVSPSAFVREILGETETGPPLTLRAARGDLESGETDEPAEAAAFLAASRSLWRRSAWYK